MEIDVAEIPLRAGFTGKELDPTTSLYYFGARYCDAWSGRWMSVNPLANKYPGWSDSTVAAIPSPTPFT